MQNPAASIAVAQPVRAMRFERVALALGASVCGALILLKVWLVWRINVNWDEFYFLSMVHAFTRGELDSVFQTAYAHLFAWLPGISGDEMRQVITARLLMIVLFTVTTLQVWMLARRFTSVSVSWIAPLCFLAANPVLRHGASFRADSLLAPLSMAVLLLISAQSSRRNLIFAGLAFAGAFLISVKAVLWLPIVLALELARSRQTNGDWRQSIRASTLRLIEFAVVAGVVGGALLLLHRWSLPQVIQEGAQSFASHTVRKVILDTPLLPRWDYMELTFRSDRATWILIAAGAILALANRRWGALACVLGLLPLLFYRNAYAYYYTVMLAPASVLAAVAIDEVRNLARRKSLVWVGNWLPLVACVLLSFQAVINFSLLTEDQQDTQRSLIAAVHEIFPEPVPYIDHSGMMASFRKVDPFFSTWGIDRYRAEGKSFMPDAIARYRAPLLLVNREILDPDSPLFEKLLPEDQRLIRKYYVPYWGPIHVAGAQALLSPSQSVQATVPFPGRYRLASRDAVRINGVERASGEVIELGEGSFELSTIGNAGEAVEVQLVWAEARPAPERAPPFWLYAPL